MPTEVRMPFIDHSRESSSTSFYLADIAADGSNFASVVTDVASDYELVKAAIAAATLCNLGTTNVVAYKDVSIPTTPAAVDAQREVKLWVQYADSVTGEFGEMNIPGPVDTFKQVNTDEVDIAANAAAIALISVLEANLVSRAGNAIQVTRMRFTRGAR